MPAVNLATKYASQLDQIWTHASYTDSWINKKYNFDGVNFQYLAPPHSNMCGQNRLTAGNSHWDNQQPS